jgi:hypothetical protein
MAEQNEQSRRERFETYNPYAANLCTDTGRGKVAGDPAAEAIVASNLAIAFELDRLRAEIHFAGKRGRS